VKVVCQIDYSFLSWLVMMSDYADDAAVVVVVVVFSAKGLG
jgi:hypothetical protein